MHSTTLGLFIFMLIFPPEGTCCLDVIYVEEDSNGRLSCKHDVPGDEVHRVNWYKSSRDDIYEDGDSRSALVSRNGDSEPYTTDNYYIDKDFSLVIYNTSIHDEGIYRCLVIRNVPIVSSHYDVKVITYEKVKSAHTSTVQYATSLRLPCSHNPTITTVVSILWYKRNSTDSFQNDDQPIASRTDNGSSVLEKYTLTDDFSLEIQNVSFENEAVYRYIVDSDEETRPSATDTNVIVYALPRQVPLIQHFIHADATFISCSVDHVYPLLYPILEFIDNHQSYEIKNVDGTYNTSISGKVPDAIHNTTVECSFPHFNYTGKSSHYIPINFSAEDEETHPADCFVSTCPNQAASTIGTVLGCLLMITCLLIVAVFVWKRHTKQQRQKDVKNTTPEIEPMV